jgi:hypothetical protein
MMGTVRPDRRGIAAGARTLLQNTGAVLSIAFVLAIITSAVPKATLFAVFSGVTKGLSEAKLAPFIDNMHVALWALAATSLVGAFVCLLRPKHMSVAESATLSFEEHLPGANEELEAGRANPGELVPGRERVRV